MEENYEQKRKVAEIVLEVLTDDNEGVDGLSTPAAIEYGHTIYFKLVEEGIIKP